MKHQVLCRWFFLLILVVILLSPLPYWLTGIGQSAAGLSAEIARRPDGTLVSSPKAEALHGLVLPMRIERLLLYPLLLLGFQLSGGALALRRWLDGWGGQARASVRGSSREPSVVHERDSTLSLTSASSLAWPGRAVEPSKEAGQARSRYKLASFDELRMLLQRVACLCGATLAWIERLVPRTWRQRVAGRDLVTILFFVLIFDTALSLLYLPFNFYGDFILGHQFGLSTQTAADWTGDWVKSWLIMLVIDGPLWTGFYGLMRLMPRRWPIPAGAMMVLLSAVFILLTPILITPLFYEVRPLSDPVLRARVLALAERAGMHVDEVYVINASAKTTEANAYFTGFGGAQRIVLYDTLLTGYTPDQVEVVLAHEMGHWHYQHEWLGLLGMGAAGWIGLFGLRWLLNRSWRPLGLNGPADVAGLPYLLAVVTLATLLSLPAENGLSRYAERQADWFSLVISRRPAAFVELFEKFAVQNLSVVDAPAWEKFVFYTHPPIAERIRMAETYQGK